MRPLGRVLHPTASDVASDVGCVCGVHSRLKLLEEACKVCEDGLQAEAGQRGALIAGVDRMAVEVDTLRRDHDGAEERLHDARRCLDDLRAMDEDKEQLASARSVEEQLCTSGTSTILERVRGLELSAQVGATMLGQRLDSLDADTAKVGDLAQIREVLQELKQATLNNYPLSTVYGSEVAKGRDVVLEGLNQAELNGMTGTVTVNRGTTSKSGGWWMWTGRTSSSRTTRCLRWMGLLGRMRSSIERCYERRLSALRWLALGMIPPRIRQVGIG